MDRPAARSCRTPRPRDKKLYYEGLEATLVLQARALRKMQERVDDRPRVDKIIAEQERSIQRLTKTNETLNDEIKRLKAGIAAAAASINQIGTRP